MAKIKNFAKKVLMYTILIMAVFICCTIDDLNLFKVVLSIIGMFFLWKTFGLSKVFAQEFKSNIE